MGQTDWQQAGADMCTWNSNVTEKKQHTLLRGKVTNETLLTGSSIQPDGSNSCLVYSHLPSYWGPATYLRTQSNMTCHDKNFKQSIQPNIKCISVQDPDGRYRMHVHEASSVIPSHRLSTHRPVMLAFLRATWCISRTSQGTQFLFR